MSTIITNAESTAMLNQYYNQATGKEPIETLDASALTKIGQDLEAASPNWKGLMLKSMVEKLTNRYCESRTYKANEGLGITIDLLEYGLITEVTEAEMPEAEPEVMYNLIDGKSYDPYVYKAHETRTEYYDGLLPWRIVVCRPGHQIDAVFFDGGDFNKFINMLAVSVENAIEIRKEQMEHLAIETHIGNVMVHENGGAVTTFPTTKGCVCNVRDAYNKATGQNVTMKEFSQNPECLRFSNVYMNKVRDRFRRALTTCNPNGRVKFTPDEDFRFVMISDFYRNMQANLYNGPNQYSSEYIKIPEPTLITSWQAATNDTGAIFDLDVDTSIDIVTSDGNTKAQAKGVIGVMFDNKSLMGSMKPETSDALYNPEGSFVKYWRRFAYQFRSNMNYNTVVFTIE